jgi:uncharacterized protein Veg
MMPKLTSFKIVKEAKTKLGKKVTVSAKFGKRKQTLNFSLKNLSGRWFISQMK